MKVEIKYLVDNESWSEEEYQEKTERLVVFEEREIIEFLKDKVKLDPDESIVTLSNVKQTFMTEW